MLSTMPSTVCVVSASVHIGIHTESFGHITDSTVTTMSQAPNIGKYCNGNEKESKGEEENCPFTGCPNNQNSGCELRTGTGSNPDTWACTTNCDHNGLIYLQLGNPLSIDGDTIAAASLTDSTPPSAIINGANGYPQDIGNSQQYTGNGAVYVFARTGTTWVAQAYLKGPTSQKNEYVGMGLVVAGDTIAASAKASMAGPITNGATGYPHIPGTDSPYGAVYIFVRTGTTWAAQAYLQPPNSDKNDYFGWWGATLDMSGGTIVVGARWESSSQTIITNGPTASADNTAAKSGAVYVFAPVTDSLLVDIAGTINMAGGLGLKLANGADAVKAVPSSQIERPCNVCTQCEPVTRAYA